jgi:hypothetical protein
MDLGSRSASTFFWLGLAGIVATGLIVGMGADNYWALGQIGSFGQNSSRGRVLMFTAGVLVAGLDLNALGLMFAAVVMYIQRGRGVA